MHIIKYWIDILFTNILYITELTRIYITECTTIFTDLELQIKIFKMSSLYLHKRM